MSRSRRRYELAAAVPVVVVFAALYAWAAPLGDPSQRIDAYLWLALGFAVPTALWLLTSWLLVDRWWEGAGARRSATDAPSGLLATVVTTLPEPKQPWGQAMLGELAQVHGRVARWRFALSCGRAMLFLPIHRRRPGLRGWLAAPVAAAIVTGAVTTSIAAVVAFVRRHPDAAEGLPPGAIALLAAVLAGCLWLALTPPRRVAGGQFGGSRLAPLLGVGAACTFTVGLLASFHTDRDGLAAVWLLFGPPLLFVVPAATAAAVDHSFRAGVRAGTWTAITVMPLTFALLLVEASRQYADDREWLFAGDVTTAGFSIGLALAILIAIPVIGLPFAVLGAIAGAQPRVTPGLARPAKR